MIVKHIRYYSDNYCYIFKTEKDPYYSLIDPGQTNAILKNIFENEILIDKVFLTHRHSDHIGKFDQFYAGLTDFYKNKLNLPNHKVQVYGGHQERFNFPHIGVCKTKFSNEVLDFENFTVECQHVPCHTRGHVMFYVKAKVPTGQSQDLTVEDPQTCVFDRVLFSGDTLFIGGCGRFFEGEAADMAQNFKYVKSLPDDTAMFPGHDYLWSNFKYAWDTDWENQELAKLKERSENRQELGLELIPALLGEEKKSNVFLRFDEEGIMQKMGTNDPAVALHRLRKMKNNGNSYRKMLQSQ